MNHCQSHACSSPPHNRGCYEALFGSHTCTLVRVAQLNRATCEIQPRRVASGMMTGSDRLAVLLVGLVINWQHLAKRTSCERDAAAGEERGREGEGRARLWDPSKPKSPTYAP